MVGHDAGDQGQFLAGWADASNAGLTLLVWVNIIASAPNDLKTLKNINNPNNPRFILGEQSIFNISKPSEEVNNNGLTFIQNSKQWSENPTFRTRCFSM
jgi:hypothetical protein